MLIENFWKHFSHRHFRMLLSFSIFDQDFILTNFIMWKCVATEIVYLLIKVTKVKFLKICSQKKLFAVALQKSLLNWALCAALRLLVFSIINMCLKRLGALPIINTHFTHLRAYVPLPSSISALSAFFLSCVVLL